MKTGQWTYTLTPEKEIWNTGAFFDTREQCIEEGIKAAKEEGDIKTIAISEIEVHLLALSISVENIIDEIAENSIIDADTGEFMDSGDIFEEFSQDEIQEIEDYLNEKLSKKARNKEYWSTLRIEEIDV